SEFHAVARWTSPTCAAPTKPKNTAVGPRQPQQINRADQGSDRYDQDRNHQTHRTEQRCEIRFDAILISMSL
ncbi:MAG TPA: hypothetical protein VHP83_06180, partial [Aggregatilineaceae bacterium]|nr:hypothetical protein [Aggregatilineaceae bacterium]